MVFVFHHVIIYQKCTSYITKCELCIVFSKPIGVIVGNSITPITFRVFKTGGFKTIPYKRKNHQNAAEFTAEPKVLLYLCTYYKELLTKKTRTKCFMFEIDWIYKKDIRKLIPWSSVYFKRFGYKKYLNDTSRQK